MKTDTLNRINTLTLGFFFFIILLLLPYNQARAQDGEGGVNNLLSAGGVGARALSLGGAFVAQADDPTAVYWNSAGLDFIEKKSVSFFYSDLNFGSSYNFVGGVYPTLSLGSFGIGWARIGTDDVEERDASGNLGSVADYSLNQFFFSYGKQLKSTLGVGASVKLQRTSFSFANNLSDTGLGLDVGIIYRPVFDSMLLRDLSFGVNIQNIIKPRSRLVVETESTPINFKIGVAKLLSFGDEGNAFRLLFDINDSEDGPGTVHIGSQYSFRDQANLRIGVNGGQVAFGAGATYNNFHFDYTFGKFFDGVDFSSNHRFSVTIDIGKGKTELIRIARERRERELQLQLANQLWFNSENEFHNRMEEGREKYYAKDYLGAYVAFSSAFESASNLVEISMRQRGESSDDPEANMRVETANSSVQEAQTMLDLANARSDSVRKAELKEIALQATQSALEQELRDFIIEHKEKGIAFFKGGFFARAISEWQLAVDRINRSDIENPPNWVTEVKLQLENDIKTAEEQLQGNIQETVKRADALARRGQYVQALDELNKVRANGLSETERKEIEGKIRILQRQLSFDQNYEEGVRLYASKEWKRAMEAFERALKTKPNDKKAKQYFQDAKARSLATKQQLPDNLRIKYIRGTALYREGKYQEAIAIWEQVLEEQPYNKTVLDAIDRARERLNE